MDEIDLKARLEAELDKSEEKQAAQHKTHSSLCGDTAAVEPSQNAIAISSEEEGDAERKRYSSSYTSTSSQFNIEHEPHTIKTDRDGTYAILKGQIDNFLTEQSKEQAFSKKAIYRGEKHLGPEEELKILHAEKPGIPEESRLTRRIARDDDEQRRFDDLRKAQNGSLFEVDKDGRLMKGANRKRGFCDATLDKLQKLQPPYRQYDIISTLCRNDEVCTEEHLDAVCEGARSQPLGAHNALFEVGHALPRMPGRSPGRKRKQRSPTRESTPPQEIADELRSSTTLGTDELEVPDSEEELFENEGVVEHSKRIKRDETRTLKQHRTETDAVKSVKKEKEYAHDNARDSKDSHEKKDASKQRRPWGETVLKRYNSNESSLPDYGKPADSDAVHVKQAATNTMRGHLGGVKPRNTLGNDPHNNPNPPFVLQQPKFNLHEDYTRRSDAHPRKKQKTEDRSASRTQAHKDVIDLETQSSYKRDGPSARSSHSQTQNGQRRNGVVEYNAVEDGLRVTKTRRKMNGPANVQSSKSVEHQQHTGSEIPNARTFKHGKVMNGHDGEDPEDPIIDADTLGPETQHRTVVGVVIPSPNRGTANVRPTRERDDKGRRGSTTARNETAITSPYFHANGNGDSQKRRGSVMSNSVDVAQNESGPMTRERCGNLAQKKSGSHLSGHRETNDLGMDELDLSKDPHRKTARVLPTKNKQLKGSSSANVQRQSNVDNESSEDELDKGDMVTNSLTRKRNQRKIPGRFQVNQVFSHRHAWLSHGLDKPWLLDQDLKTGILKFFNADGHHVPDLDLMSTGFNKIERNDQNGKLVIHKPADDTARGAHHIHLELANKDQSDDFYSNICRVLPTIGTRVVHNLDKVFAKTQSDMPKPKPKRNEDLEDIQLAKRNREGTVRATFDKAQAAKDKGLRMIDNMRKDVEGSHPGTRRLVRGRKTSPIDPFDIDLEESPRPTKIPRLDDSNPHATRSRNASGELASRRPPKPRSPSPERWTELNPDWAKLHHWHSSIIYPKEGKNKATVDKQDIERLDEGQFLNDNLIMFYLLKLEQDLAERNPVLSKRVYFHNTFFYERLTKPVKGKKGINYEAVERWTSKVDLFSYDYIIVPVNEHSHWYVAIIYNAPKLLNPEPDVIEIPQSQQTSSDARKTQSDADAAHHSSPVSSPKLLAVSPSAAIVGEPMRKMSLKEDSEKEWPDADPMNGIPVQAAPKRQDSSTDVIPLDPHSILERVSHVAAPITTGETPKPAVQTKRGKRKSSTPAPRKFSPKEPKIITLDSLGLSHSATCTNLRDYLVAEGNAKRNVEISPPRQLGMTAVNIPTQKNYCDCGLFLLSYVEHLLKDPDEFTEALLGKVDIEVTYDLTKAPEMRKRIRVLLFDLQAKQVAEKAEKDLAKQKGSKGKKALKAPDGLPTPAESGSRESSKSARPSVDSEHSKSSISSAQPAFSERGTAQESNTFSNLRNPPHVARSRQPSPSGSVVQAQLPQTEPLTRVAVSQYLEDSFSIGSPERDTQGLEPRTESAADIRRRGRNVNGLEREMQPDSGNVPKLASRKVTNVEEEADDITRGFKSKEQASGLSASLSSILKTFTGFGKDSKRSNSTQPGASRTNALEVDDESPRKENNAPQHAPDEAPPAQELRDLESPLPEVQDLCPPVHGRASTPHPRTLVSLSPDIDEALVEDKHPHTPLQKDSQTPDSSPLESAAKPPLPRPASDIVDMTGEESQENEDQEMLLQPDAVSAPLLLDSPIAPVTPSRSVQKPRGATSPQRTSTRKLSLSNTSQSTQSVNARQRRPQSVQGRDSSDKVFAEKWKGPEWRGTRTKF